MERYLVIMLLCSGFSFVPSLAFCQGRVITLEKNMPAPFGGTLMDADAVARILADKEYALKQCELDKTLAIAIQKVKLDLDLGSMRVERDILQKKFDTIMSLKDAELTRAYSTIETVTKSNRWYWAYFVGGVLVGSALTVGVAYSVSHASK
jgi:hypothetical protein